MENKINLGLLPATTELNEIVKTRLDVYHPVKSGRETLYCFLNLIEASFFSGQETDDRKLVFKN